MLEIFVDGGVIDGDMYIGIFCSNAEFPINIRKKIGRGHTHTAEEEAIYYCINIIKKQRKTVDDIVIYSDHSSLVNVLNNNIKQKHIKTFPRALEIQNFLMENGIQLKWIETKCNKAHSLVVLAEKETLFYNETPFVNGKFQTENAEIFYLKNELIVKSLIIKELLNIISQLNENFSIMEDEVP